MFLLQSACNQNVNCRVFLIADVVVVVGIQPVEGFTAVALFGHIQLKVTQKRIVKRELKLKVTVANLSTHKHIRTQGPVGTLRRRCLMLQYFLQYPTSTMGLKILE